MRLLVFSDVHVDLNAAKRLVELSSSVDIVLGAGDFSSNHQGLEKTINVLSGIKKPLLMVPGNNESFHELSRVSSQFENMQVLHGTGLSLNGFDFWGLGAGVPETPWDWSFDLSEHEAFLMLEGCPEKSILITHSPPKGHVDKAGGSNFGSESILECVKKKKPLWVFCGHIHECWEKESFLGGTKILNCGPNGRVIEI
ncbi:serine/threonine protein phosphatase [bacterium]|nr:serine/threonine protein phosphatase [bacterium]|tara:strand:- start:6652 stop:7245 length:594 start_codon:yes stop_codon:yes gene_type:complete